MDEQKRQNMVEKLRDAHAGIDDRATNAGALRHILDVLVGMLGEPSLHAKTEGEPKAVAKPAANGKKK